MFGGSRMKSSQLGDGVAGTTQYSQISGVLGGKFPSASETKQDYFKVKQQDAGDLSSARSKLLFSPATHDNGGLTEDEYNNINGTNGILSDREAVNNRNNIIES